jgi:predicted Zn-dependent protease
VVQRPRHQRARLLAVLLTAGALLGFDVHRSKDGRPLRWPDREVPVFVVAASFGGVSVQTLEAAAKDAIEGWQAAKSHELKLVYGGRTGETAGFGVTLWLRDEPSDPSLGEPIGRVQLAYDDAGNLERADVGVNVRELRYGPDGPAAAVRAELRAVVRHLLGHAIGLSHSGQLAATMGFLPLDADKISLEDDDIAGLRRLYGGPHKPGSDCDACDGDGDCALGARCLRWPNGSSYCARACAVHDDCAVGQSCGVWAEGSACLPNEGHCAPDLGQVEASGACKSDLACDDELFCLVQDDQGFCTGVCLSSCGPFGTCTGVQLGSQQIGLCLMQKARGFGAPCLAAPDCASLLCSPSASGGGRCSARCVDGCPSGAVCEPDGSCAVAGERALGWPCASGFDCASGLCVPHGDVFERVCSAGCVLASECPAGTGCTPTAQGAFCLPFGAPPLGFPCSSSGACGSGRICVPETAEGVGACRLACDPFDPTVPCDDGGRCVFVDGKGACQPSGGGRLAGAPCVKGDPCRIDLVCAGADAAAGSCHEDCDPADGRGCDGDEACVALLGDVASIVGAPRGVCSNTTGALTMVTTATEDVQANFAARTLKRTDIEAWSPPGEPVEAEPAGCAAGPGGRRPPAATTLASLLLALIALLSACGRLSWRR